MKVAVLDCHDDLLKDETIGFIECYERGRDSVDQAEADLADERDMAFAGASELGRSWSLFFKVSASVVQDGTFFEARILL